MNANAASVARVLLPENTVCVLTNFHILQTSYWLSMYDRLEERTKHFQQHREPLTG